MTGIERTSDLILLSHYNHDLVERHPDSIGNVGQSTTPNQNPVYGMRTESRPTNMGELFDVADKVDEIFREQRPQLP